MEATLGVYRETGKKGMVLQQQRLVHLTTRRNRNLGDLFGGLF
jgi:hypothetical protein